MIDDTQWHNRKDLRGFYADLVTRGWDHLVPLLERLDDLLAIRDKMGLFTYTSHERVCFSRHPTYPAWFEDNRVVVAPLRSGGVEIGFVDHSRQREEAETVQYADLLPAIEAALTRLRLSEPPNNFPQPSAPSGRG